MNSMVFTLTKDVAEKIINNIFLSFITKNEWKKFFVDNGRFLAEHEKTSEEIFEKLAESFSKENMENLAADLQDVSGYDFRERINQLLLKKLDKQEISHEQAQLYANKMIDIALEKLRTDEPNYYDRVFLSDMRKENEVALRELSIKVERTYSELKQYKDNKIGVYYASEVDLMLKQKTINPQIGISFFAVDDDDFQSEFDKRRNDEFIVIKCRCREEAIYSIINELWKINDSRDIFVVTSKEDWEALHNMDKSGNVFIPWFFSDEITPIPNNTCIFTITDDIADYRNNSISIRPRLRSSIVKSLEEAGLDYSKAYELVEETHGLFMPLKKKILRGISQKKEKWIDGLTNRVKKTCLLVGSWTDTEGDRLIIEKMSGLKYEEFIEQIEPYCKGEDPLIYTFRDGTNMHYCLASAENTWAVMTVEIYDSMWNLFKDCLVDVINEAERLFTYSHEERLEAQWRGEKLFWSKSIRKGMLNTLLLKACFKQDEHCQRDIDSLVSEIMDHVDSIDKWKYISRYIVTLSEAAPGMVMKKLNEELTDSTGLVVLFSKQAGSPLFYTNEHIQFLYAIELLMTQERYAIPAFSWIAKIDNLDSDYVTNAPADSIGKAICTWHKFGAINDNEQKIKAVEILFDSDKNAWERIYRQLPWENVSIFGGLATPKYRAFVEEGNATKAEVLELTNQYLLLLMENTDDKPERWKKLLKNADHFSIELRAALFKELKQKSESMEDEEIIQIIEAIRDIIYHHRFYCSASWAMDDSVIDEYIDLMNSLHTSASEYEYRYLFKPNWEIHILNPYSYDTEKYMERNSEIIEKERQAFFKDFNKEYRLNNLIEVCKEIEGSTLGEALAQYYSDGFETTVFDSLLKKQPKGELAAKYYSVAGQKNNVAFSDLLSIAENNNCSIDAKVNMYRVEALLPNSSFAIQGADEEIKKLFWKRRLYGVQIKKEHLREAIDECRKYGNISSYIDLLYDFWIKIHDIKVLYEKVVLIPTIEDKEVNEFAGSSVFLKELLKPLQEEFESEEDKITSIALVEMTCSNLLEWEDMKCFSIMLKKSPKLFADIISVVYKKDDIETETDKTEDEKKNISNLFTLYRKAKFCPAEENGIVYEEKLRQWMEEFRTCLMESNQSRLFSGIIGRLLSFSPAGEDGYEPHESVRNVIEDYYDDKLNNSYSVEVQNRRGVFTPTAGRKEKEISQHFKENADAIKVLWPKTAEIYYGISDSYINMSRYEREQAENEVLF